MNLIKIRAFLLKNRRYLLIFVSVAFFIFFLLWTQPNLNNIGTIKIWDRHNLLLYESSGTVGNKIPVTYSKFPKDLINATIATEDDTFWKNSGIDLQAIVRSAMLDIKAKRIVSGASTITQQLARISIISSHETYIGSFLRKIREVIMAIRINATHSKTDIITMYLNQVYYGNLAYGAQAASRVYFNKDVSELSLAESAFLAGLLSSPSNRDPFTDFSLTKQRQTQVLDLMVKRGFINSDKASDAKQEKVTIVRSSGEIKAPHFVNYVLGELTNLHINITQGINIHTTLDYPTYSLSDTIATIWVDKLRDQHDLSNASVVLIKNNTGEILDMLGGIDYFDLKNSGEVNMAIALRQPGSALKPITYATAFMQGYTPATLIYDVPKVYTTKKGEGYTPNNYDGRYHGLVLAREALASSLNLPAVEMLNRIGISNFLNTANSLGITTLNQENRYDLSLTLGGGEIKLLDLTNVYASFARGGEYIAPYAIEKITSDKGEVLYQHNKEQGKQVLGKIGEQVAYLISNILSDPQARLLGFYEKNPLVLSHQAAVKTGTTTDWHDNWTVGYTPSYTVGVWVGNNDNHAMKDITGVVGAAPIWNQFFEEFLKGKPTEQFIQPPGMHTVQICKLDGLLPDLLCPDRVSEIFINGTEPKKITSIYKKVKIDTRNNLLASSSCPQEYTQDKILINYPSEVYTWAVENNQDVIPQQYSPFCLGNQRNESNTFIEVTSPKAKSVFEDAPELVTNQGIVFEVNVSANVTAVEWHLDGKLLNIAKNFPYSTSWNPQVGKHIIEAEGITETGTNIKSDTVPFSVILYGAL